MTDFSDASFNLLDIQHQLGLTDWDIRLGTWLDEDECEDANVRFRLDERCATIRINPAVPADMIRRVVAHELIHVLLKDLTVTAMTDQSERVMDILTDHEELVCNRLATALTGQAWKPLHPLDRKYHSPFMASHEPFL